MSLFDVLKARVSRGQQAPWVEAPTANLMKPVGPATQDQILFQDARDGMLFLSDGTVAAGVQVFSVAESLLTDQDITMRVLAYRESLLKHARFNFQWLIGTRPQILDEHVQVISERLLELATIEIRLTTFATRIRAYVAHEAGHGPELFAGHFGIEAKDFLGLPGDAHHIAEALCDPARIARLKTAEETEHFITFCANGIEATISRLHAWSARLRARTEHLDTFTAACGTPVRTLYIIVSHNPREVPRLGPLDEGELAKARQVLDERCGQLINGLAGVRVRGTRASHAELLREIQHFFHPADYASARPPAEARVSVARETLIGE